MLKACLLFPPFYVTFDCWLCLCHCAFVAYVFTCVFCPFLCDTIFRTIFEGTFLCTSHFYSRIYPRHLVWCQSRWRVVFLCFKTLTHLGSQERACDHWDLTVKVWWIVEWIVSYFVCHINWPFYEYVTRSTRFTRDILVTETNNFLGLIFCVVIFVVVFFGKMRWRSLSRVKRVRTPFILLY